VVAEMTRTSGKKVLDYPHVPQSLHDYSLNIGYTVQNLEFRM